MSKAITSCLNILISWMFCLYSSSNAPIQAKSYCTVSPLPILEKILCTFNGGPGESFLSKLVPWLPSDEMSCNLRALQSSGYL